MDFGPGIVVYFQSLKYFAILFTIMTILSVPSMIFYYSGNLKIPGDLKGAITALSLGNIGGSKLACDNSDSDLIANTLDYQASMSLTCNFGVLDSIKEFGQVSQASYVDCNTLANPSSSQTASSA